VWKIFVNKEITLTGIEQSTTKRYLTYALSPGVVKKGCAVAIYGLENYKKVKRDVRIDSTSFATPVTTYTNTDGVNDTSAYADCDIVGLEILDKQGIKETIELPNMNGNIFNTVAIFDDFIKIGVENDALTINMFYKEFWISICNNYFCNIRICNTRTYPDECFISSTI